MKVLVTGADGFIGSHLTEALVRDGFEVRALVQYNSFNSWGWLDHCPVEVRDQFEVVSGDIRDPHSTRETVKDCEVVLHLAALIAIPFSYHSPASYIETNVNGTLNVLQAARDQNVSKIIHTSTSEVYGTAQCVPMDEKHRLHAQSPYAASKIAADQIALSFFHSFGTPVAVIRPFNTYGPRQSARAIIPTIIKQVVSGADTLQLGSLTPTRDFSFVSDTVSGFVSALTCDTVVGTVTNLGSGFEVSIGETVEIICELIGNRPALCCDSQRGRPTDSEVDRLLACYKKAQQAMNWQPEYRGLAGFKAGLKETIDWFTNPANLGLYRENTYDL